MTRRAGRALAQERARLALELVAPAAPTAEQLRQVLEDATVNVVCAPEDRDAVQRWVDELPDWPVPVKLRTSCFLAPGRALYWQPDGVHAPSTPRTLAVRLPGTS